ncbi:hypothetical protein JOF53_008224 [Crossiella equi]|uniref:ABC-2 family transporter protein n=1 Tax=Crossiella equi TaxID=130796 RepID=A0ABS5ASH9_9PSEU|nr:hypothetical protein [Crossiella equi]MBP2479352.1 hypothetical protein [Crossiella equi]
MSLPAVVRLATGDFRDRVRRPAYVATLLAAIGLGYLASPAADSKWAILQLGAYRGVYNSAYIGTATALAATLWLLLGGFYVVRNTIARDETTGVGHLLASTPLRTPVYLVGKFLSNIFVLGSMLIVLSLTALVMQLARGESMVVDPVQLLQPFLLIAFPVIVLTSAFALVFELTPVLKTGAGNVLWFFVWLAAAFGGMSPAAPLGGLGLGDVMRSLGRTMQESGIELSGGEFSLGLTYLENPLLTFDWPGYTPTAGFIGTRFALMAIALAMVLVPTLWFKRFDPSRSAGLLPARQQQPETTPEEYLPKVPSEGGAFSARGGLRTQVRRGSALASFPRLLVGEIRILLQGVSPWWWAGLAFAVLVTFAAPIHGVSRLMLPSLWIWPVVLWSRLGTQRHEHEVQAILGPYPAARRRLLAEWLAGVSLTAFTGGAAAIRFAYAGDGPGLAAWLGAVVFIPSLALFLGSVSRTHRFFQAAYLPLWYCAISGLPILDYLGAIRATPAGLPVGIPAELVGGTGAVLFAFVLLTSSYRPVRG